jgi:hypothetical protein
MALEEELLKDLFDFLEKRLLEHFLDPLEKRLLDDILGCPREEVSERSCYILPQERQFRGSRDCSKSSSWRNSLICVRGWVPVKKEMPKADTYNVIY